MPGYTYMMVYDGMLPSYKAKSSCSGWPQVLASTLFLCCYYFLDSVFFFFSGLGTHVYLA